MKLKLFILLFFICGICFSSIAQTTLTGSVVEEDNKTALPFVNIGIKKKNIGTCSLIDGTFTIKIPALNENDTLTFSMVGHSELNLAIHDIVAADQKTFQLKAMKTTLKSVVVTSNKLMEKKFGIKTSPKLIHFNDGSTNQNDIFEIAQLIRLDTTLSRITSVNLHLTDSRSDSGTFRINFYGYDGSRPTERIVERTILQTKEIKEGWLKFDLRVYNVYLKGKFVVAIEFIPPDKKSSPIYYEVKIGGPTKSFVRASSQGEWNVPPAHYRLFITALVAEKKTKEDNSEEKESIPTTTLFSESVKDSFSIFISLPKEYSRKINKSFPVIYLLDANVYFDIVADAMNKKRSNAILVGIGYKDFITMDSLRNRDYTFPKAAQRDSFPVSGGADKFLTFIRSELIPYIDKTYQADTGSRTLMGHSLGGYFPLYALKQAMLEKNNAFKNYVAASPSLEYGNNYLAKQFQNMSGNDTNQQTLFLTYGGREDSEEGGTGTAGIDNFNSFVNLLSDNRFKNISVKSEIYPTFGHMETAVPTFTKALPGMK